MPIMSFIVIDYQSRNNCNKNPTTCFCLARCATSFICVCTIFHSFFPGARLSKHRNVWATMFVNLFDFFIAGALFPAFNFHSICGIWLFVIVVVAAVCMVSSLSLAQWSIWALAKCIKRFNKISKRVNLIQFRETIQRKQQQQSKRIKSLISLSQQLTHFFRIDIFFPFFSTSLAVI